MNRWILLVGGRSAALKAARRLGLRTLVLSEAPVHPTVRRHADEARSLDFFSRSLFSQLARTWRSAPPLAVVPLTEEAVLPAAWLRADIGLPGLRPAAAERFRDKRRMKAWFRRHEIPCAEDRLVRPSTASRSLLRQLGLPLVLKPRRGSGSRNTAIALDEPAVLDALLALRGQKAMAERFVDGREVSVESFVVGGAPVWTNITSYEIQGQESLLPAPDLERPAELLDLNARVLDAMGLERGMTHLEAFCTTSGWVVGEIAARPPGGFIMSLIERAYGFEPWRAYLQIAIGQAPDLLPWRQGFAAVHLLRAPEGIVQSVEGLGDAARLPGVIEAHCMLRPGDRVPPVLSVSSAVGRVLVHLPDAAKVRDTLRRAVGCIRIHVG